MNSTMQMRFLQPEDVVQLAALINRNVDLDRVGQRKTIKQLNEWLDEPHEEVRANTIVVLVGNKMIAYQSLCFVKNDEYMNVYSYGTVDGQWRRKGIGSKLLYFSLKHLKTRSHKEKKHIIYHQMARTHIHGQQELAKKYKLNKLTELLSYRCTSLDIHQYYAVLPVGYSFHIPKVDDASHWAAIYRAAFSWVGDERDISKESIEYEFQGTDFSEDLYILCKNEKNEAVGWISSHIDEKNCGTIWTIAVHPRYQGFGIGKALLHEVMKRMKTKNVEEVRLSVDQNNPTAAIHLYEKTGFRLDRSIIHYMRKIKHHDGE